MYWKSLTDNQRPAGMAGAVECYANEDGYVLAKWDHNKFTGWVLYEPARRFYSRRRVLIPTLEPVSCPTLSAQQTAAARIAQQWATSLR